jgi:hypothetical protein
MAFSKAFYEQCFERNLKQAKQQQQHTGLKQTQTNTVKFTAYAAKEVVRHATLLKSSIARMFFFGIFLERVY